MLVSMSIEWQRLPCLHLGLLKSLSIFTRRLYRSFFALEERQIQIRANV